MMDELVSISDEDLIDVNRQNVDSLKGSHCRGIRKYVLEPCG